MRQWRWWRQTKERRTYTQRSNRKIYIMNSLFLPANGAQSIILLCIIFNRFTLSGWNIFLNGHAALNTTAEHKTHSHKQLRITEKQTEQHSRSCRQPARKLVLEVFIVYILWHARVRVCVSSIYLLCPVPSFNQQHKFIELWRYSK